jgi:hypothetical protein
LSAPCSSTFFSGTTEVRVSSANFAASDLVPDHLLRRQPDDGAAKLAGIVAKLAERCGKF